ncbi:MAG: TonB-dependent receptor [Sphingobium sp.]
MRSAFRRRGAWALGVAMAGSFAPVMAQEEAADRPAEQDGARLADIVVTAQRRSENMQRVPIAVTAVGGESLQRSGIEGQKALTMVTPNLSINQNSQFVTPYLRGVGTQYANPGLESSIATYFDDLYIARPTSNHLNFNDVERVEILRGPQGILYGRNSSGGAIRIIPKQPTHDFEGRVSAGIGSFGRRTVDGVLNLPLTDNMAVRITGLFDDNHGYIKNLNGGPRLGDRHVWMTTGQMKWEPTEQLTVRISGDYSRKRDHEVLAFMPLFSGLPEQAAAAQGGQISQDFYTYSGNIPYNNDKDQMNLFVSGGGSLKISYEADPFTITSITGYRYNFFSGFGDLDASTANILFADEPLERTRQYSQEIQIVSNDSHAFGYQAGIYAYREVTEVEFGLSGQSLDSIFPGARLGGRGSVVVRSLAPYGQLTWKPSERWELTAGARYTMEDKTLRGNDYFLTTLDPNFKPTYDPYIPLGSAPRDRLSFKEFTPRLSLTYRPDNALMLYGSYSRGFKSGGYNLPDPDPASPPERVDTETLDAYELGWKFQRGDIRLNGSAFLYDIKGLQLGQYDDRSGITTVRNAASARIKGFDVELSWAATDHFQIDAGGGYLDTRFKNYANGPITIPCAQAPTDPACIAQDGLGLTIATGDLSGRDLPFSPPFTAFAKGTYRLPLPETMGKAELSAIYNYSDGYIFQADGFFSRPSLSLVNLAASWASRDDRLGLSLSVTNLFDEKYIIGGSVIGSTGGYRQVGRPREVAARISYNF